MEAAADPAAPGAATPRFERGAVVWAKIAGFPWWPARVAGPSGEHLRVKFYGTSFGDNRDFATVSPGSGLLGWAERTEWLTKCPYSGKSKMIKKQWQTAVAEAQAPPSAALLAWEKGPSRGWRGRKWREKWRRPSGSRFESGCGVGIFTL